MDREVRHYHALSRASERYGKKLSSDDLLRMVGMILRNESRFVSRLSKSRVIRIVHYRGCDYKVLWNRKHHRIMTFLPADFVQPKLAAAFPKGLPYPVIEPRAPGWLGMIRWAFSELFGLLKTKSPRRENATGGPR